MVWVQIPLFSFIFTFCKAQLLVHIVCFDMVMYCLHPYGFRNCLLWRESIPNWTSASSHGHTSSNVQSHDLDTLKTNLKEYSILIHIFTQFCGFVGP